jgi:hypothetical protein
MSKKETTDVTKSRRFDWNRSHQMIEKTILDYLRDNKTLPTHTEIARITGLNRRSVIRHMNEMTLQNMMPSYKSMTPAVMNGLLARARSGAPQAVKIWLQVVDGFKETYKTENDHHFEKDLDDDHALAVLEAGADTLRRKKVGDAE